MKTKRRRFKRVSIDFIDDVWARFRAAHKNCPATSLRVAQWAKREGLLEGEETDPVKLFAKRLSRRHNQKFHHDKQGRKVHTMCAARFEKSLPNGQRTFDVIWDEIETMSDDHAQRSFMDRHGQWVGSGEQLKTDMSSFYENNPNAGPQLQLPFDLEMALENKKKKQRVETVPIDQPMQMIETATEKSMSAAKKRIRKDFT